MRARNRLEHCYSAKCCGAPVVIRTAAGKVPHFVHKFVPKGCDGDRRESPEHRRLKYAIASYIAETYEWEVETEAVQRDAAGKVLWRADVLAWNGRATLAFEVQLSNADYEVMRARQRRYKESGVRGLWFVRTKKGFPLAHELPIFPIESESEDDFVRMDSRWDPEEIWLNSMGVGFELRGFVEAALRGQLKWSPFETKPETLVQGFIDYEHAGKCLGCSRPLVRYRGVRARIAGNDDFPEFIYRGSREYGRRSAWFMPIVNAVWPRVRATSEVTLSSVNKNCAFCSGELLREESRYKFGSMSAQFRLGDLPPAKFGTVERDWLRRWAVLDY